jgi:hypothetical protein
VAIFGPRANLFMNLALLAAAGGLVMLLATPVLAMTALLVAMERFMGSLSSTRRAAATRYCFSTCSGSIRIPPFTS